MQTLEFKEGKKYIYGLVHVGTTPGSPFFVEGSYEATTEKAVNDARALYEGGATGCLVQTVDRIYTVDQADPVAVAHIARITTLIKQVVGPEFQVGVQIMVNNIIESMAIAKVCGGVFLRCAALIGQAVTPWGLVQAKPYDVMAYRRRIGADHLKLVAEIDSRHFSWGGNAMSIGELARMAKNVGAAAVEISNRDVEKAGEMVQEIKKANPGLPVILGGFTNASNVAQYLAHADGAFVGSAFEKGDWGGVVHKDAVQEYMEIVRGLEK